MAHQAVASARGILGISTSSTSRSTPLRHHHVVSRPRARPAPPRASPSDAASTSSGSSAIADYFATDKRPVILFDGVCNLCNGGVNFALDMDPPGMLRFAALQSTA